MQYASQAVTMTNLDDTIKDTNVAGSENEVWGIFTYPDIIALSTNFNS